MLGSVPDLLRLLALPVFGWAAYRDVHTRRVPNKTWLPLVALGAVLLAAELVAHYPFSSLEDQLFLTRVGVSLLFVAPLGYLFWRLGGFGGADAKAMMTLALLFPTYPSYAVLPYTVAPWFPIHARIPLVDTTLGVFSLTVITNTVVVGMVYPLVLAGRNAMVGRFSPVMFVARVVPVSRLPQIHGRLFETREGFTRKGLDLDALRMYLRWRGVELAMLRTIPDWYRDPSSVRNTFDPTDGAVGATGRAARGAEAAESRDGPYELEPEGAADGSGAGGETGTETRTDGEPPAETDAADDSGTADRASEPADADATEAADADATEAADADATEAADADATEADDGGFEWVDETETAWDVDDFERAAAAIEEAAAAADADADEDPLATAAAEADEEDPLRKVFEGEDPFSGLAYERDPWAAERFLAEIEGSAYGTTPEELREGLELVAERETVWVSPGLPFVVPMFVGLLVALTYGDVLFGLMLALGLV